MPEMALRYYTLLYIFFIDSKIIKKVDFHHPLDIYERDTIFSLSREDNMNKFNSIVEGSLAIAQGEALKRKNTELFPEHLMFGLISNPQTFSSRALKKHSKDLESLLKLLPTSKDKVEMENLRAHSKLSEWLTYASSYSIQSGRGEITESDLLKYLAQIMPQFKIDYNDLKTENADGATEKPDFLTNLNELAESGKLDPVIGRSREIRAVMEILGRRNKNNPVLVGPAGVGKTAIVEGLADAIVKGKVPDILEGKNCLFTRNWITHGRNKIPW